MSTVQAAARNFLKAVAVHAGLPESDFWKLVTYGVEALRQEGAQVAESVCTEVVKDRELAAKQAAAKAKPSRAHLEMVTPPKTDIKSSQPIPGGSDE